MPIQIIQLIQRQVPIGSTVTIVLTSGLELSGTLVELGENHISLQNEQGTTTVTVPMIGAWQVLEEAREPTSSSAVGDSRENDIKHTEKELVDQSTVPDSTRAQSLSATSNASESNQTVNVDPFLIETKAELNAYIASASLGWQPPDFEFPTNELNGGRRKDALAIWNQFHNRYEYAKKINELSPKHGRIPPMIGDLKRLVSLCPQAPSLYRYLAYLYYLLEDLENAQSSYLMATHKSRSADDWRNLAALALKSQDEHLACYALANYFALNPAHEDDGAWYAFVGALRSSSSYPILPRLWADIRKTRSSGDVVYYAKAGLFLLLSTQPITEVHKLALKWQKASDKKEAVDAILEHLRGSLPDAYSKARSRFERLSVEAPAAPPKKQERVHGIIYTYKRERNFGFITGNDGGSYFFHRSAVIDAALQDRLLRMPWGEKIPVTFEVAEGPKGPLALKVSLERSIDDLLATAQKYASAGDYAQAIGYIRQLLDRDADHTDAQQLYEKWRQYARITGVPKGSNPYARAKRVHIIEKDLQRAAKLFLQAIEQGDNVESAIKDLSMLYDQQGDTAKAISLLKKHRGRLQDKYSVENMLIMLHIKVKQYVEAIDLLNRKLSRTRDRQKRTQIKWQIANSYLNLEKYDEALRIFSEISKAHPSNLPAQRNIAICLFKQQKFDSAERLLNQLLDTSPDAEAAELLEAIKQARTTGESSQIDEIIVDTTLSEFSGETSGFSKFFLARCEFEGVPAHRVNSEKYRESDIRDLESLATRLGTKRPRDRASYYLSAARVVSVLDGESSPQFFRYLGRSFASSGDATVAESKPLDSAKEWYCEALSVYDKDRTRSRDEQDAVNALVRYLYATLGQAQIPLTPKIPSIDDTLEEVIRRHPQQSKVFDAIGYLIFRSRYAANRLLRRIHRASSLQAIAVDYLRSQGISVPGPVSGFNDFVGLWNELRRRKSNEWRGLVTEFRFLTRVELTTASLEACIKRLKAIDHNLLFDLDQQRVSQLQSILESCHDLVREATFEEQERLCLQVESRCQDLLGEIQESPTKLSVEQLYGVLEAVEALVQRYLADLYESSIPELDLRLAKDPDIPGNDLTLEIQITVENKMGRSPAEQLTLVVLEDEDLFQVLEDTSLDESLRGGEQRILVVPVQVTPRAIESQTFSLQMYAQYRTRSHDNQQTPVQSYSIRLYPADDFEPIPNPYDAYAEGGVVDDPTMFYGREELIESITKAIVDSGNQSKSIVVFGQKRAGKSSILYHVNRRLVASGKLLVLDIGNIGSIIDEESSTPFTYQILWSILQELNYTIQDQVQDCGYPELNMSFPNDLEFYNHPSPLTLFKDSWRRYMRKASLFTEWSELHAVLLIDEFSYIYEQIVKGNIPPTFMKNWKALLQENLFSVVLVGQDVMPKFKRRFPNEFGTTQDERVSYLRPQEAIRLIDEPIRIGGRNGKSRYREKAIDQILALTAGSPFYIQIMCNRLVRYMKERKASLVTEADVQRVKAELIGGVNPLSQDKFDNLISSGDTSNDAISDMDTLAVLKAIALNSRKGRCNRNSITCETETPVDLILDDLVNREVIEREQGRYYSIRLGLFRDWLVAHQ